jgi:hypothetical protein
MPARDRARRNNTAIGKRKRKRKRRGHEHLSPVKPVKPLEADR